MLEIVLGVLVGTLLLLIIIAFVTVLISTRKFATKVDDVAAIESKPQSAPPPAPQPADSQTKQWMDQLERMKDQNKDHEELTNAFQADMSRMTERLTLEMQASLTHDESAYRSEVDVNR